jgi:glycosyltransferase involved in cell wall biosynthesis
MYARADVWSNPGGDTVEAETLCDALRESGHEAVLTDEKAGPGPWHIVHLINVDRAPELAEFLDRHRGFPDSHVVFAPVFSRPDLPSATMSRNLRASANLIRTSPRPSRNWIPGRGLQSLAGRVEALHFHTRAEGAAFRLAHPGFAGIELVQPPPLVWPDTEIEAPRPFEGLFVAVVARVEPLKNQLWLLESGLSERLPVVFVGAANPKRPGYVSRFENAVSGNTNVAWLGGVDRRGVRSLLEQAALHILASSRENFGLATVEALSVGCEALVPAHHMVASEYGPALHTFDGTDPDSLLDTVHDALHGPRRSHRFDPARLDPGLAAEKLVDLYRRLLER